MKFLNHKKIYCLIALFASLCVRAETEPTFVPGYNAPSRFDKIGLPTFYATGSFIYWQPMQENMELGIVSDNTEGLDLVKGDYVDLDFGYKPGFKLGFGVIFDYDNWDLYLQYTWLRGSHQTTQSLNPNNTNVTLWPAWQSVPGFVTPQYVYGKENWKVHLDLLDLDLGRSYSVGTQLTLHPFLGARAAWIRQDIHVDYRNTSPAFLAIWPSTHIDQSSNCWGLGTRAGLGSNWMLCHGFRLYGNGEVDILYTQYTHLKSSQKSEVNTPNRYVVNQKNADYLRAHLELLLGFGWGCYFANNASHVDLSADYGFQVFFDQNMFRNYLSDLNIGKSFSPNGNLYIHGLTVSLRFDF